MKRFAVVLLFVLGACSKAPAPSIPEAPARFRCVHHPVHGAHVYLITDTVTGREFVGLRAGSVSIPLVEVPK